MNTGERLSLIGAFAPLALILIVLIIQFAMVIRIRSLARSGRLPADAHSYLSPLITGGLITWNSLLDDLGPQVSRKRNGRLLALLLGRRHLEIADGWVSGLIYAQRALLGVWIALAVGLALRR